VASAVTTKDLAKLSCEDLGHLYRILSLLGKQDAAKKVLEVAKKKGCTIGGEVTGELIL